jgi:hypothetical protein
MNWFLTIFLVVSILVSFVSVIYFGVYGMSSDDDD